MSNSPDRDRDAKSIREETRKLFTSLIFGWVPGDDNGSSVDRSNTFGIGGTVSSQDEEKSSPTRRQLDISASSTETERVQKSTPGLQQQVALQIDKLIPKDPHELRRTTLFQEAYKGIQWQRDNYLVGREYANWRKRERLRMSDKSRSILSFQNEIQFDETALAHGQLAKLAASFIPSDTVKAATLPLVTPLFGTHLYAPSQRAVVHIIEGQQDNLNRILKNQVLQFLNNPDNRTSIKASTKGFISTTYRDCS